MNKKILLVDDNIHILTTVAEALEFKGYRIATASSGEAALETLDNEGFDLVITDLNMYEKDGFTVLKKAKELNPETTVILFTAAGHVTSLLQAVLPAFDDYLPKPCGLDQLFKAVASCLEKSECKRDARFGHIKRKPYPQGIRVTTP